MSKSICSIEDCQKTVHARGWCVTHYRRWDRTGDPCLVLNNRHNGTPEERFWAKVDKSGDCWIWTGALSSTGYGNFYSNGKFTTAHRFSLRLTGAILDSPDVEVDHRCHNKRCVRPSHLRIATPSQNCENYQPGPAKSGSGVRGVSWDRKYGMWRARVQKNRKCVYQRRFRTLREAEVAVIAARNRIHTHNDTDRAA